MSSAEHEGHEGHAHAEPATTSEQEGEDNRAAPSLLELILAQHTPISPPPLAARIDGVVLGRIVAVDPSGAARVSFPGSPEDGFAARVTTALTKDDEGREAALMFEQGDPRRPIIMGKMVSPLAAAETEAAADGRRVEISAEEEIVLRCGESSITLTRGGKIIIRGAYVLSRSSGVNRIQGGSVEIN